MRDGFKSRDGVCEVEGCGNKRKAAGLCSNHYKQRQKYGKPGSTLGKAKGRICSVEGCNKTAEAKTFCRDHYVANWKYGSPTTQLKHKHNGETCVDCGIEFAKKKLRCNKCYYKWKVETDPTFVEKMSSRNSRRRAHKLNNGFEKYLKSDVVEKYGTVCHLCGEEIDTTLDFPDKMCFTIDHVIPISKGGSDTLENVLPAHFSCNSRKRDRENKNVCDD